MVPWRELEAARALPVGAPAPHLQVAGLVGALRHAGLRQVGQRHQHLLQFGLDALQSSCTRVEFGADATHLGHHGGRVATLGLELADLPGQRIAPRLQLFGGDLDLLAFGFQRREARHVQVGLRVLAPLNCAITPGRSRRRRLMSSMGFLTVFGSDMETAPVAGAVFVGGAHEAAASGSGRHDLAHAAVAQPARQREVHVLGHAVHLADA